MSGLANDCQSSAGDDRLRSRSVVYFDGVCGLCDRSVNWILEHDSSGKFLFAPLQGDTAATALPSIFREDLRTVVLHQDGKYWIRSAAVCRILQGCGGIWRVIGAILWLIPGPLRDAGYRCVAAFRYKLFGRLESCRMPKAGEQDRFLP